MDPFNTNPFWLYSASEDNITPYLSTMTADALRSVARKLRSDEFPALSSFLKQNCLEFICRHFISFCTDFVNLSSMYSPEEKSVHSRLYERMCNFYGEDLANQLRLCGLPSVIVPNFDIQLLPECTFFPGTYEEQISKLSAFSLEDLSSNLQSIPSPFRPPSPRRSCKSKAQAILFHVWYYVQALNSLPLLNLQHSFLAKHPLISLVSDDRAILKFYLLLYLQSDTATTF